VDTGCETACRPWRLLPCLVAQPVDGGTDDSVVDNLQDRITFWACAGRRPCVGTFNGRVSQERLLARSVGHVVMGPGSPVSGRQWDEPIGLITAQSIS